MPGGHAQVRVRTVISWSMMGITLLLLLVIGRAVLRWHKHKMPLLFVLEQSSCYAKINIISILPAKWVWKSLNSCANKMTTKSSIVKTCYIEPLWLKKGNIDLTISHSHCHIMSHHQANLSERNVSFAASSRQSSWKNIGNWAVVTSMLIVDH